MSNKLLLERCYFDDLTLGKLTLPSGFTCWVLERPWLSNIQNISCIPEGLYKLKKRRSGIVNRTTNGKYVEGFEVTNVAGRSFIMIHPGNWVDDTQGCLLPGEGVNYTSDRGFMVTRSNHAFNTIMTELGKQEEWLIQIKTKTGGSL